MQLPLELKLGDDATFANFVVGSNHEVIQLVQERIFGERSDKQFYIWGDSASGRSHLLQACCHLMSEHDKSAIYLPLTSFAEYNVDVFENLDNFDLVCLDDIDALAGNSEWEQAVFRFYNAQRDRGGCLMTSAKASAANMPFSLADLRSRLSWGLTLQLRNLNDKQKQQVLRLRAKSRGMDLSREVAAYMLTNYSRDLASLIEALDKLDQATLVQQRKLTVPFVKSVLSADDLP